MVPAGPAARMTTTALTANISAAALRHSSAGMGPSTKLPSTRCVKTARTRVYSTRSEPSLRTHAKALAATFTLLL